MTNTSRYVDLLSKTIDEHMPNSNINFKEEDLSTFDEAFIKVSLTVFSDCGNDTKTKTISIDQVGKTCEEKVATFLLSEQDTFKEEDKIVSIMPYDYQIAVETYIRPIDIQLIQIGEKARIEFDGWPAIVFNGWPNASFGTYGAEVVAIENYISENNLYRVLLKPDSKDHVWPNKVRIGSGARTIALLNEVPVWYEIWRQLNGFPADYYKETLTSNDSTVEKN